MMEKFVLEESDVDTSPEKLDESASLNEAIALSEAFRGISPDEFADEIAEAQLEPEVLDEMRSKLSAWRDKEEEIHQILRDPEEKEDFAEAYFEAELEAARLKREVAEFYKTNVLGV